MGQKIHPRGLRLGYIQDWQSKWFSLKKMPELIGEDFEIRNMIRQRFQMASVSWVDIERAGSFIKLTIHTARPGVVIGRRGTDIETLKKDVETLTGRKIYINVSEIKIPEMDPRLVGQAISQQLEKRIGHKKAIKRAMERPMASGAQEVLPRFFTAAAQAVAGQVEAADLKKGILLPSVARLREVSLAVALAVGETAIGQGVAKPCVYSSYQHDYKRERLQHLVEMMGWQPRYLPIVPR